MANLNHVELSDAILLDAHGHGDAILLDQHVGRGAGLLLAPLGRGANPPGRPSDRVHQRRQAELIS